MPNAHQVEYGNTGWQTPEQKRNASIIISVGRQLGMTSRDIQIGLMAAMQESGLRNLHYGDRDSLGLFQQRAGWGSEDQRLNPAHSATMFFNSLRALQNRNGMSMAGAAQAVQRSAFPHAYAKHEAMAHFLFNQLGGEQSPPTQYPSMTKQPFLPTPDDFQSAAGTGGPTGLDFPGSGPADELPKLFNLPNLSSQDFTATGLNSGGSSSALSFPQDSVRGSQNIGMKIVAEAQKFLGTPYVWGGTEPGGFDCSGLVQYVYGKQGINLPRISYQQANYGHRVGFGNLRPGDLVAWDNSSRNSGADHIAIYAGSGMIVEAPRPGKNVRMRKLGHDEGAWGVRMDW